MHLIEDHTRQQDAPDASLMDSAEDLHWAVMPYADPELFADVVARHPPSGGESSGRRARGILSLLGQDRIRIPT
ncbi:hypothetical protein RM555_03465 [Micromonospora sp. DSM 115977]|uniref:Uncharacterized protein n=1 Tax=Micromonospora reichwaldensis TaxID=3075516 RepID=A0ABU2WR52_9ACTN|nr:hypothetical protein [Micromonospora sp. DSM 115977]MDT0528050.1 hypothetical protein [Micromonospora sp. DSM 115977]